jgi:hypothetical protein
VGLDNGPLGIRVWDLGFQAPGMEVHTQYPSMHSSGVLNLPRAVGIPVGRPTLRRRSVRDRFVAVNNRYSTITLLSRA